MEEVKRLKAHLHFEFKIKYVGELRYFLGIEFARLKGIAICQRKYTLDLLEETRMLGAKPIDTAIKQNHKISDDNGELLHDIIKSYQQLVG